MAAKNFGIALGLSVAALLLVAMISPVHAQTLSDPKNQGRCNTLFNSTLNTLYANDTACQNLLYTAFAETNKAKCPPTNVGSPVHLCLNKNSTGTYVSTWAAIISSCEYLYIANRQGAGESETGFTFSDNSCFEAYDSWAAFYGYLSDSSPYGAQAQTSTIAGSMAQMVYGTLFGALALAMMVWMH